MTFNSTDRRLLVGLWLVAIVLLFVALEWRSKRAARDAFLDTYCTSVLTRLPTAKDTTIFTQRYPECLR
jgi:hypothetical protein